MRLLVGAAVLASVLALGTTSALAGEITGNGTLKDVHGNSPCAYSGQEDLQWYYDQLDTMRKPADQVVKGDPAHSQNWGQIVRAAGGNIGGAANTGDWGCNAHIYGMKDGTPAP